jgi:hypothetical protein
MFEREVKNLDLFFWKQQMNYMESMKMKAAKAMQKAKEEFRSDNWSYDNSARSWSSKDGTYFILDRGESITKATLQEKVMLRAASVRLPDDALAQAHLTDMDDAKNAMQMLMAKERKLKIGKIL